MQETNLLAIAGQKLPQTVWGQKGSDLLGLEQIGFSIVQNPHVYDFFTCLHVPHLGNPGSATESVCCTTSTLLACVGSYAY